MYIYIYLYINNEFEDFWIACSIKHNTSSPGFELSSSTGIVKLVAIDRLKERKI